MLHAVVGATGAFGIALLAATTDGGTDYQGIAFLIGSISTLIATIGGLVIAMRKKPADPAVALAIKLLQEREEENP